MEVQLNQRCLIEKLQKVNSLLEKGSFLMEVGDDGSDVVSLLEIRCGTRKSGQKGQRLKKKCQTNYYQGGRDQKG